MAALSVSATAEADAISAQIRTVAIIAAASAIGTDDRRHSRAHYMQCLRHLAVSCCSCTHVGVCDDCVVTAIFAVWLRDRLWPSRSTARTTIGADRAARKWTEDDLDKVYLIAPSP